MKKRQLIVIRLAIKNLFVSNEFFVILQKQNKGFNLRIKRIEIIVIQIVRVLKLLKHQLHHQKLQPHHQELQPHHQEHQLHQEQIQPENGAPMEHGETRKRVIVIQNKLIDKYEKFYDKYIYTYYVKKNRQGKTE